VIDEAIILGSQGDYDWLISEHTLDELLDLCPDVVLGKYVAVTSFDSGPLCPTDKEKATGWQSRNGIAYSPRVADVSTLPHDLFDEWYVFDCAADLGELADPHENVFEQLMQKGRVRAFVNFGESFALHRKESEALMSLFWQQFDLIQPESYIGDGDCLNFVTKNKQMFNNVVEVLSKSPAE